MWSSAPTDGLLQISGALRAPNPYGPDTWPGREKTGQLPTTASAAANLQIPGGLPGGEEKDPEQRLRGDPARRRGQVHPAKAAADGGNQRLVRPLAPGRLAFQPRQGGRRIGDQMPAAKFALVEELRRVPEPKAGPTGFMGENVMKLHPHHSRLMSLSRTP